jgi:hypothetical protein
MSDMKQVMFQGINYTVPEWAKWITKDVEGDLFCHQYAPYIYGTEYANRGHRKFLGNINCVEIV